MAEYSQVTTAVTGNTITAAVWNNEFSAVATAINSISNAQIASDAAIAVSKIATGITGSLVGTTDTQTLTNKTITSRVNTTTSSATPSINTDTTDMFTITALATDITSMTSGLSGTPTNGRKLIIRILDNGVARSITWGASFASRGVSLPTTTTASKYLYVGLIYNSTASVWDCVAVSQEI